MCIVMCVLEWWWMEKFRVFLDVLFLMDKYYKYLVYYYMLMLLRMK